ncbi:MAG: Mfa1 family fimbria major subunit [Tannerella sp.]|jgi:hypothetical protein|nr:Mfa1 family fimbria major subunit [Tannerella sp.]
MNLKWKNSLFILVLGIGMAFTSCSEDNMSPEPEPEGPVTVEGEDGFLSFRLTSAPNAISTRSADWSKMENPVPNGISTRATDYGDKQEYVVKSACVIFYDTMEMKVVYQMLLDINNGDGSAAFAGAGVATHNTTPHRKDFVTIKAQKIKKRDYKMLVILNPKDVMTSATTPGKQFSEFEKAYTQVLTDLSSNGSYLQNGIGYRTDITMTNADWLTSVKKTDFEDTEAAAEAKTNLPKVKVDRVLAKVEFTKNANTTPGMYPNGGELGEVRWILDITNKHTFWIRKMAPTAPVYGGNANGPAGPLENDPSILREHRYAIDPNWDNISKLRTGSSDPIINQFNTFSKDDITSQSPLLGETATRMYVLENTMAKADQWEDVTTRILMKANFRPLVYGSTLPVAANSSYYFYGGAAFTHDQLKNMISGTLPWPTSPSGLEAVVKTGSTITDLYLDQSVIPTAATSKTSADGKLTLYKDGISYYAIKIRHFNDTESAGEMNYGRYGIVRNNVYKVNLSKVAGPGKPDIPKPEGPDDEEEGYISATIEVNEWVSRTQAGEI